MPGVANCPPQGAAPTKVDGARRVPDWMVVITPGNPREEGESKTIWIVKEVVSINNRVHPNATYLGCNPSDRIVTVVLDDVLRILHTNWPGVRPGDLLAGGHRNLVLAATLGGLHVAVRRSRRTGPALAWEFDLVDVLARAGFIVPRPIPAADGGLHHEGVCVITWLDGDSPETEMDWRRVAATLRRLHAMTAGWTQRPGFAGTRELLERDSGGDVDLSAMPPEAVAICRNAWRAIAAEPESVVHGDPGAGNIRLTAAGVGLIDWDEARVDASALDLAENPRAAEFIQPPARLAAVRAAADAWEVANGWQIEPGYARRKLAGIRAGEMS